MPRRVQDGGGQAARAGAGDSVSGGCSVLKGAKQAQALDRAYFKKNPQARSYTRPYIEGECDLLGEGDPRPLFVAVAFVSSGIRCKAAAFDRAGLMEAKREAEALAAQWRGGAARGASA
ncbi:hypothetical protein [Deinococcus aestuarii]|uniref:hypothetical protein n=1 Tax=Deinococcus aestuarii TaxID=2774531 RepID=UPI001C0DF79C|nr:hypothetical protein [Deinococcus aestuarii]